MGQPISWDVSINLQRQQRQQQKFVSHASSTKSINRLTFVGHVVEARLKPNEITGEWPSIGRPFGPFPIWKWMWSSIRLSSNLKEWILPNEVGGVIRCYGWLSGLIVGTNPST
jgi:hypothetical protein